MLIRDGVGDEMYAMLWDNYDWDSAEKELLYYQRQLAKAVMRKDGAQRVYLQSFIVQSDAAKMLAVHHVCEATGGPGIDGVRWTTSAEKMKAALALTSKDYHAKPMRMILIRPKGGGRERHVNVPTMHDRAMQVLYAYSLDPIAETTGEKKSFAFRQGRSMMDVHAHIMTALYGSAAPEYLILADVKACYESISHKWLLAYIPMDSNILKQFLKSGHVFNGELFPPDDYGISLGANLSPILGNMVLDRLQSHIYHALYPKGVIDYANGNLIRFADDIIITARSEPDAENIIAAMSGFLAERGLALSAEKTKIISIRDGFDFLSRHYEKRGGVVTARPSDAAIEKKKNDLRNLILPYRGSQKSLIDKLNQSLNGWATYHKITNATEAFRTIDVAVKTFLLQLCESKHSSLPRKKIIEKYFYKEPNGEYVYALPNKPDERVVRLSKTILTSYSPVRVSINPYLDANYFEARTEQRSIQNVVGKYKAVWTRQNGRCHYCGRPMLPDHRKSIVPLDASKDNTPKNMAYIHKKCLAGEIVYGSVDVDDLNSPVEINGVLEKMQGDAHRRRKRKLKFDPLTQYFHQRTEPVFTMTFKQIGEIIGERLCDSAYKFVDYWYRRGFDKMSEAWLSNGYRIRKLYLESEKVVFERTQVLVPVHVPEVFLRGRIPADAVT